MSRARVSPGQVHLLLAAGALSGLLLAGLGVLEPQGSASRALPDHAIALVEGRVISRADYERALANVAADRRDPRLGDDTRARILDRLIDEELLVQRGLELGLAERDPRVRADLSAAVVDLLIARVTATDPDTTETVATPAAPVAPDNAELERFYDNNRAYFARPARVRVHQRWFTERARAEAARVRWHSGDTAVPAEESAAPAPVPDALLPPAKLRDYLGATAADYALRAPVGQVSPVLPAVGGYRVLRVLERQPATERPLDEVREQVRAEYQRRRGEREVRRFLDQRRARADIRLAEDAL